MSESSNHPVQRGSLLRCGDCRSALLPGLPSRPRPGEFYCPDCDKPAAGLLDCPHCGSQICPACGTPLESANDLGIG